MRLLPLWLLASHTALAAGLLERNHPLVEEGTKAYTKGDYEAALNSFDEAAKVLPPKASLEIDRAAALHKLGRQDEAKQALLHAAELDKGGVYANTIHYNLGNVWAALGDKKAAVAEYRKALRADPSDGQSRHNLEVLLRDLPPPKKPDTGPDGGVDDSGARDGGSQDAGAGDAGSRDGGRPTDGGSGDAGAGDGGGADAGPDGGADGGGSDGGTSGDGGRGDGGSGDGGRGDGGSRQDGGGEGDQQGASDAGSSSKPQRADGGHADGGGGQDGGMDEEEAKLRLSDGGMGLSKKEAESLLDAMKNGEKQLQLWRFQQKRPKKPNAKDW